MQTDLPLTTFSASGERPTVHSYFDLCPESPDGEWVTYFAFDGPPPSPGRVMVARRDGSDAREVGRPCTATEAHSGAMQQWVSNEAVAYNVATPEDRQVSEQAHRDGPVLRQLAVSVRMFCDANGVGLGSTHEEWPGRPAGLEGRVYRFEAESGASRTIVTLPDCLALHPQRDAIHDRHLLSFKHTKWSPDGARFFVVFNNEPAFRDKRTSDPRVKCLMVADADGANLRYQTEFGHHPMWAGDGTYTYYYENRGGRQALVRCGLDGVATTLLTDAPGVHGSISPDNRWLVTDTYHASAQGEGQIVLQAVADGAERHILARFAVPDMSRDRGCHTHPVWSRDGRRIYFASNETGRTLLHALDLDPLL